MKQKKEDSKYKMNVKRIKKKLKKNWTFSINLCYYLYVRLLLCRCETFNKNFITKLI